MIAWMPRARSCSACVITGWRRRPSSISLSGYQTEYASGLQERLSTGIPSHLLADYRLFLDKLARAIGAQGEEVERNGATRGSRSMCAGSRCASASRHWKCCCSGIRPRRALQEARREQKQQDEFALKSIKENPLPR